MKRFARFLFHFDGGKTDSRGEIIFDPYDQIRRGPIRASGGFRERPVFGEVNWNPGPRLERRGATRGRRTEVQQETECEGEECCGRSVVEGGGENGLDPGLRRKGLRLKEESTGRMLRSWKKHWGQRL